MQNNNMSKEERERTRLQDEFNKIQSNFDFDISTHLALPEDLPDLGSIEVYDYESDIDVSNEQSTNVLESLVDLYLGDVPKLKEHPYIKYKMKEDADVYAEAIFLTKITRNSVPFAEFCVLKLVACGAALLTTRFST